MLVSIVAAFLHVDIRRSCHYICFSGVHPRGSCKGKELEGAVHEEKGNKTKSAKGMHPMEQAAKQRASHEVVLSYKRLKMIGRWDKMC